MKVLERPLEHPAIYKIENLIDGNFYVGSTINALDRYKAHKTSLRRGTHSSLHLQSAWNKYGEENFMFYVIEYPAVDSRDSLFTIEQEYLDKMNPKYNMHKKCFGHLWSDAQKKLSSDVHKLRLSTSTKRVRSDEEKQKISGSMIKVWEDSIYKEKQVSKRNEPEQKLAYSNAAKHLWSISGTKENIRLARLANVRKSGYTNKSGGLAVSDIHKMRELHDGGMKRKEISKLFPAIPIDTIGTIIYRQAWKDL